MRFNLVRVLWMLALAFLAAACSDDDGAQVTPSTTPTRAATPTAGTPPTPSLVPTAVLPTATVTTPPQPTPSWTPDGTGTAPPPPTRTPSPAPSWTPTTSATATGTPSATATASFTATRTATETHTPRPSATPIPTSTPIATPADDDAIDILVFTRTAGFRHISIDDAKLMLNTLSPDEGIRATITEDPAVFDDAFLARYEVIAFVNTTGDVLDATQQAAVERFVRSGRGYVGVHSAADTEYDWPWYGRLVGAYFKSHPLLPVRVDVTTEDPLHPTTQHLDDEFVFVDEIYNFDRNPRRDNSILLTVDEAGFVFPNTDGGPSMGADHPIAWYKEFDGGRSFYTNLGHSPATWENPLFRTHLLQGIRWAAEPPSYRRTIVTTKAENPLSLAVAPDGRVFYSEITGTLRVWHPTTGRVDDILQLDVSLRGESGLLGLALDPAFADNGYLYLYFAEPDPEPLPTTSPIGHNVLARFTVAADGSIDPTTRVDLLEVPSDRTNHEAGGLAFGPDGSLFLSVGDNTNPFDSAGSAPIDERPGREIYNAQRTSANPFDLRGKILRIRPDGTIPEGNLFPASGEQGRPEIFAMGCRNPFRLAVDPSNGRLFWGDVGPDAVGDGARGPRGYDEINFADTPGHYGWPFCIADNRPYADVDFATGAIGPKFSCDGYRPALMAYDYLRVAYLALGNAVDNEGGASGGLTAGFTGRTAIAGTVYPTTERVGPVGLPDPYRGTLIMTEWTRDILASVEVAADGALGQVRRFLPWERFRRPIDVEVGPDGALYVLEFGTGLAGDSVDAQLSRIEYAANGDLPPVAVANVEPNRGPTPLTVRLSAAGSHGTRLGGAIVAYEWDLDADGSIDSGDAEWETTFTTPGVHVVTLTVRDASGRRSLPAAVEVRVGNTPPQVRITQPADGATFRPGETIQFAGEATDAEDGAVDCGALRWDIRLGHNAHSHPITVLEGCTPTYRATLGGHDPSNEVFYVVELRYTDQGAPGAVPLTGRAQVRLDAVQ